MTDDILQRTNHKSVAILTLNRPSSGNAIDLALAKALMEAAIACDRDESVRAVRERTADRNRLWAMTADIMLVAKVDGTIEASNPAWQHVLGWTESELVGASLFDLIHPDDLQHTIKGAAALGDGRNASAVREPLPLQGRQLPAYHLDGEPGGRRTRCGRSRRDDREGAVRRSGRDRGATAAEPEDGGGRTINRRRRERLQQSADGYPWLGRSATTSGAPRSQKTALHRRRLRRWIGPPS